MGDMELQIFADRLKELRQKLNITQKDFAERIGITAAALSSYENNIKNPSIAVAKRIAETFSISIDWLCGLSEKMNNSDEIKTYADMFRLIIKLVSIDSFFGDWDVSFEDNNIFNDMSRTGLKYAYLRNNDATIADFFKDWEQMKSLYDKGTIDEHLYNLWISDKLKQFETIPLCPPAIDYDTDPPQE